MFPCKFSYLLLLTVLPFLSEGQKSDEQAIRRVIEKQSEGWNKGNIEEYMKGYWESDSLIFVGKSGVTYGYKNTLDHYRKAYPDKSSMGLLQLDLLRFKRLSSNYYYVTGKWSLKRTIGNLQGYFTLLFQKMRNSWVIISDHSS
ncbi:MAG TPA: DUF4440 domain-containing protein [Segetibacter sp.]|nr:DUF4440 domain-containing protein [Segetibacter sp.]